MWLYVCLMRALRLVQEISKMFQQEALPLSTRLQIRLFGYVIARPSMQSSSLVLGRLRRNIHNANIVDTVCSKTPTTLMTAGVPASAWRFACSSSSNIEDILITFKYHLIHASSFCTKQPPICPSIFVVQVLI